MRIPSILLSVFILTLGLHASAHAATVAFNFSGTLDRVDDPNALLDLSIITGIPYCGTVFYDPDELIDESPEEPKAGFFHSDTPMTTQLGDVDISSSGLTLVVADNRPWDDGMGGTIFRDVFLASMTERFVWEGITIGQFSLHLDDRSGTAFDDDGLPRPEDGLVAEDFPDNSWLSILGWKQGDLSQQIAVHGTVDFINVIPEPATLILLTAGLLASKRRLGRKRQS